MTTIYQSLCEAREAIEIDAGICGDNGQSCDDVGLVKLADAWRSRRASLYETAKLLRKIASELVSNELEAARESHAGVIAQIEGIQ